MVALVPGRIAMSEDKSSLGSSLSTTSTSSSRERAEKSVKLLILGSLATHIRRASTLLALLAWIFPTKTPSSSST